MYVKKRREPILVLDVGGTNLRYGVVDREGNIVPSSRKRTPAENEQAAHLGQALVGPVSERFRELTRGRYGLLALGPHLETQGIEAAGGRQEVDVLSVGTRDQLSTILRLSLAEQLGTAVLLDDQLAQSDPRSMGWFGDLLRECAWDVQVVVLTCRPEDYLQPEEMPGTPSQLSLLDSSDVVRAVDLVRIMERAAVDSGGSPGYRLRLSSKAEELTAASPPRAGGIDEKSA